MSAPSAMPAEIAVIVIGSALTLFGLWRRFRLVRSFGAILLVVGLVPLILDTAL